MPVRKLPCALLALTTLLAFAIAPLPAQEQWLPRTSGTTAHLWGVAYGNNQWVAVGDPGIILTSPDGVAWTRRDSGFSNRWFTDVTYALGTWVVVGGTSPSGDNNAVILTSTDAVTWTPRVSNGTRLNNVAYGNETFFAVDESGGGWTSLDGVTWSLSFTERKGYLRGLAFGRAVFVAGGLAGTLTSYDGIGSPEFWGPGGPIESVAYGRKQFVAISTDGRTLISPDGQVWGQVSVTTTATTVIRSATFFNNQFIAVGGAPSGNRGIATSIDGKVWLDRPTNLAAGASLLGVAAGPDSAITVGQNGIILQSPAAASPPFVLSQPLSVAEAIGGNVAFSVAAGGSLPLSFQWRKDGNPLAGATSDTLFLTAVQATHAGTYSCVIRNASGSTTSSAALLTTLDQNSLGGPLDTTFALDVPLSSSPRVAALQSDGKILLGGAFQVLNQGRPQSALARLHANGSLDTTFAPGVLSANGAVAAIAVQADGKILVGGNFVTIGGEARRGIARLNPDGSVDPSFVSARPTLAVRQIELSSAGRIIVVDGSESLVRLNSDGSADSLWGFRSIQATVGSGTSIGVVTCTVPQIVMLADDGIAAVAKTPDQFSFIRTLDKEGLQQASIFRGVSSDPIGFRFLPNGILQIADKFGIARIPTSGNNFLPLGSVASDAITCLSIAADGSAWIGGSFVSVRSEDANQRSSAFLLRNQVMHLNANLEIDSFDTGLGLTNASGATVAPQCLLTLPDGRVLVCGDFTQVNGLSRPYVARLNPQARTGANPLVIAALEPEYRRIRDGESITLAPQVVGSAPYYVEKPSSWDRATGDITYLPTYSGRSAIRAINARGASAYRFYFVRILPSLPVITTQPRATQTNAGRSFSLTVDAVGTPPLSYQWFKNGTALAGASTATYSVAQSARTDAGDYTVRIGNSGGIMTSETIHVGVDETARILNLATRGSVGPGSTPLIAGFVIQGTGTKRVLLRAVGPTLGGPPFNVPGVLTDPVLSVFDSRGNQIYFNDDWGRSADAARLSTADSRLGAFSLPSGSFDSGGVLTLAPGAYSAHISGKLIGLNPAQYSTGVVLAEIYEDDATSSRLVNLSSLGFVGPDGNVMIPAFVTNTPAGAPPKRLLIRGVGPTLTAFGVAGALVNPTLSIVDRAGKIVATNDDWGNNPNLDELRAITSLLAFPLAESSRDSALLVSLPPGSYTCLVSGVNNTTGTALVEVYEVP